MATLNSNISRSIALVALASALPTTEIEAQVAIDGTPSCAGCTIQLTPIVTLGAPGDPEEPGTFYPARDSRGRFLVASKNRTSVLIYDSTGRFLTAFGHVADGLQGRGTKSQIIVGKGDTLLVFGNEYYSVYSSDLTFLRTSLRPGKVSIPSIMLSSGQLVSLASEQTPQEYQARFHVFDAGGIKHSFLASQIGESRSCSQCTFRSLVPDTNGLAFWSARRNRYEIERWTPEGLRLDSFAIQNSPWFRPWTESFRGDEGTSVTDVVSIDVDAQGMIWVYAVIRRGSPPPANGAGLIRADGGTMWLWSPAEALRNSVSLSTSVIEVLDMESRRVIASQRFPGVMIGIGGGLHYQAQMDSLDRVSLRIGRLAVVGGR